MPAAATWNQVDPLISSSPPVLRGLKLLLSVVVKD